MGRPLTPEETRSLGEEYEAASLEVARVRLEFIMMGRDLKALEERLRSAEQRAKKALSALTGVVERG